MLDEPIETVKYDPLGAFHVDKSLPPLQRFSSFEKLVPQIERFSPQGAREMKQALPTLQGIRNAMVQLPSHLLVKTKKKDLKDKRVHLLARPGDKSELGEGDDDDDEW